MFIMWQLDSSVQKDSGQYSTTMCKNKPKVEKDPKVTPETIKLAQVEVGSNLLHTARAVF